MQKQPRKPVHVTEMLEPDLMGAELDAQARKEGAKHTAEYLAKGLFEASKAEHVVVAKFRGEITDEKSYADYPTRIQALDKIAHLANKYPKAQIDVNHVMTQQTARIMNEIIDGISRGKLPSELADEETDG